jgi:hypothetical protein
VVELMMMMMMSWGESIGVHSGHWKVHGPDRRVDESSKMKE